MDRAGRLMGTMKLSRECASPESLARAAWPRTVGKRIAAHTGHLRMVRETLVVEVEDAVWQRQLFTMRSQILAKLRNVMGSEAVEDVEFRIVPLRLQPQREQSLGPLVTQSADDADQIADPVLRRLYVAARKRASA